MIGIFFNLGHEIEIGACLFIKIKVDIMIIDIDIAICIIIIVMFCRYRYWSNLISHQYLFP